MGHVTQAVVNEKAKYTAAAFDRASTAIIALGVFTPFVWMTFGIGQFADRWGAGGIVIVAGWLSAAVILHYIGKIYLEAVR